MPEQVSAADDQPFHGIVAGRELLELLKMLHRTCSSGVLHLVSGGNRASACLDRGSIRSAFFNDLAGPSALSRILLMAQAEFRFEIGTAHSVAAFAVNIAKDTALILMTVEQMLAMEAVCAAPAASSASDHAALASAPIAAPLPTPSSAPSPAAVPGPVRTGAAAPPPAPATDRLPAGEGLGTGSALTPATGAALIDTDRLLREAAEAAASPTARATHPERRCREETARVSMLPDLGSTLGPCTLREEIGRGASAIVYRAEHRTLHIDVVVKLLIAAGADEEDQHQALTINEARILARLNHPNILRIFDFCEVGPYPHLVVEYVPGASLAAIIARSKQLPADEALPIFCQVAGALAYAHEAQGLVHCDIKPNNILVSDAQQAKLADFALAKVRADALLIEPQFRPGQIAGTPAYIAPEQVSGGRKACDHRSDIYALGATFYQCLTGRLPFVDDDPLRQMVVRLSESPIPPHLVNPKLDRRVSQLVMSMMARDPANRIQTYAELLDLLGDLLEQELDRQDRDRASDTLSSDKVIRRRTSFWNYVPNRLFRRFTSDSSTQHVG